MEVCLVEIKEMYLSACPLMLQVKCCIMASTAGIMIAMEPASIEGGVLQ